LAAIPTLIFLIATTLAENHHPGGTGPPGTRKLPLIPAVLSLL